MTKESDIEERLIAQLTTGLKYTLRNDIKDRKTLEQNFREKFNRLNHVNLTDSEFLRLRDEIISSDAFAVAKLLREQQHFERRDGTPLYYTLVNTKDWCKNDYEVVNQLRINTENSNQRYDVILLINGLPIVQIELKGLSISPRKAMQQIVDYKNEAGNGYGKSLMCFMQLFIVSNQSNTYYFSNNRNEHFKFDADEQFLPIYQLADENNDKITHLTKFSDKFLSKCKLGEMISKYMVLVESEQKILVMRPYQIYAVKQIVACIDQNRGNGYIWHTTGSGKTLTSFKASTLLKENPNIDKCLFVVDRKDLDRQTREEFNKFQEGCVEENTNTETLVRHLLSEDYADKVIVTTIQKLGIALDGTHKRNYKERLSPLKDKRMVFIFDECHRSQFGDNHRAIKDFFPNAQLFGFTGTPIFAENATQTQINGEEKTIKTTEDIFQNELHAYTITHAINDRNVLKFHIDYFENDDTQEATPSKTDKQRAVIESIIKKHAQATYGRKFNALFATASIKDAIAYHGLFKEIQQAKKAEDDHYKPLNIACVFSPPSQLIAKDGDRNSQKNAKDIKQLQEDLTQEKEDNKKDPEGKKKALMGIIADYNAQFNTNHSINDFDLYYQDVQSRIKDQRFSNKDYPHQNKIDVAIVVDMLLTGFDSKFLNTLYVDKHLKHHGLIQAFSRTNRVLNDTKPYGNILDFKGQEKAVNDAIALFSGEQKQEAKEIWLVKPAQAVIEDYEKAVKEIGEFMENHNLVNEPSEVYNIKGDRDKMGFLKKFKAVQRLKTQLDQYTDLSEEQRNAIETILPKDKFQGFKSSYIETARQLKERKPKDDDSLDEEMENFDFQLSLFASVVIDYDYIMKLIADNPQKPTKEKMTPEQVIRLIKSHANLMDEQEDLTDYIENHVNWEEAQTVESLKKGYERFKDEKYNQALAEIAKNHHIDLKDLKAFVKGVLIRMIFNEEELTDLLASLNLGWKARSQAETALMADLAPELKKRAGGQEISGLSAYE